MIRSDRSIATGSLYGPTASCYMNLAAAVTTTMNVMGGAQYYHWSSGTITNASIGANSRATAAGAQLPKAFTVTNITRYAGCYAFDQESVTITFSNPSTKVAFISNVA